ncbi:MAG: DUF4214 domain-containing protein [Pyrinomonadaceae bacterium]
MLPQRSPHLTGDFGRESAVHDHLRAGIRQFEIQPCAVQLEYFGYMRRDPDEAGYAHWLAKLNQFGGDFVAAEMVLAFISSPEYRSRFGQPIRESFLHLICRATASTLVTDCE